VIGSAAFDFRPGASIDDALRAALEDDEDGDRDAADGGARGAP
jgi:hypothetical protein